MFEIKIKECAIFITLRVYNLDVTREFEATNRPKRIHDIVYISIKNEAEIVNIDEV